MKTGIDRSNGIASVRPKILITDTNRWPLGPRLAIAFSKMDCDVAFLCPSPGHPIEKTSVVHRIFHHRGLQPLNALRTAIDAFEPDIVVPLCDRGVQHLHDLHSQAQSAGAQESRMASLIERSLGSPDGFGIASSRHELLSLARSEGILVPRMIAIEGEDDLNPWDEAATPPWVIKADGTWGGKGVRVANSKRDAERDFREFIERPGLVELTKRILLNRDRGWILSDSRQGRPGVIAQSFINGRPANIGAVCWQGELLAGICVEVILAQGLKEPATVVQVVPGAEMMRAAERIVHRLKLTGFFGLDFVIENGTGSTYLIEMNPRCTPQCPLALGHGQDLVAAFCTKLAGQPKPDRAIATAKSRIAYFPQCWERGGVAPGVQAIDGVYCDVPEEPELVQELLRPWSLRSYLGQMLDTVREKSNRKKETTACLFGDVKVSVKASLEVDDVRSEVRARSN